MVVKFQNEVEEALWRSSYNRAPIPEQRHAAKVADEILEEYRKQLVLKGSTS